MKIHYSFWYFLSGLAFVCQLLHAQNFTYERTIGNFDGYLQKANSTAVDQNNGNIYVISPGNYSVQVFDKSSHFLWRFGEKGNGNGQFQFPVGITLDSNGDVYVVDYDNNRVQVFDNSGKFLRKFGAEGSGDGQFNGAAAITTDGTDNGNLYVTDRHNHRVQVFTREGQFLFKFGSNGTSDGEFINPSGIAANEYVIYVIDEGNRRIQLFDKNGNFTSMFGSSTDHFQSPSSITYDHNNVLVYVTDFSTGRIIVSSFFGDFIKNLDSEQLYYPNSIAVDNNSFGARVIVTSIASNAVVLSSSNGDTIHQIGTGGAGNGHFGNLRGGMTTDAAGNFYVADPDNNRIQIFDNEGNFINKIGSTGTGNGQLDSPNGVAVDPIGNIFVADAGNNRIQMFTNQGVYLKTIGRFGEGNGEFSCIRNLVSDAMGNIYVQENHRVQVFSSNGTFLRKFGSFGDADGQFNYPTDIAIDHNGRVYVADYENSRIQVLDGYGNFIRKIPMDYPASIAVDGSGNIYVTEDSGSNELRIFSNSGNYIGSFDMNNEYYSAVELDNSGNVYISRHDHIDVFRKQTNEILDFSDIIKVFNRTSFQLTAKSRSVAPVSYSIVLDATHTGEISLQGSMVTMIRTGTVKLRATASDDLNYSRALKEVIITIVKSPQVIELHEDIIKEDNAEPFNLLATASSGLIVNYTSSNPAVASVNGREVTIHKAGETTLTASQDGDVNYEPATPVSRNLMVRIITGTEPDDNITVNVYPNPVTDNLILKSSGVNGNALMIVDLNGKTQSVNKTATDAFTIEFDVSQLRPGIYFLIVQQGNRVVTKKVVKM